jgi:hypothetical protein
VNKIITRLAGIAGAVALGVGVLGVMAPDASAYSRGTASKSEISKLNRAMDRQKCVTLKETRKILKANGTKDWSRPGAWKGYTWNGTGDVEYLDVRFHRNCVYYTEWSYAWDDTDA